MFCRSLFVLLYCFFGSLCCLSFFKLRIRITILVSLNYSFYLELNYYGTLYIFLIFIYQITDNQRYYFADHVKHLLLQKSTILFNKPKGAIKNRHFRVIDNIVHTRYKTETNTPHPPNKKIQNIES